MASGDDILKTANRLFGKVGSTVAKATRQVTGLGLGTIRITLDRAKFAPGDRVPGTVVLELAQAAKARRLVVGLRAVRIPNNLASIGGVAIPGTPSTMYQFVHELGGERTYDSDGFAFELTVPKDALDLRGSSGTIEWRVFAALEIPWGRDVEHAVDITVE